MKEHVSRNYDGVWIGDTASHLKNMMIIRLVTYRRVLTSVCRHVYYLENRYVKVSVEIASRAAEAILLRGVEISPYGWRMRRWYSGPETLFTGKVMEVGRMTSRVIERLVPYFDVGCIGRH